MTQVSQSDLLLVDQETFIKVSGLKIHESHKCYLKILLVGDMGMYENHYKEYSDNYNKGVYINIIYNLTNHSEDTQRPIVIFLRGGDARSGSFRMSKDLLGCQEAGGRGNLKR